MSSPVWHQRNSVRAALAGTALIVLALLVELLFPESPTAGLIQLVDASYVSAALRLTVPIAFAALGGIFAEKSGVINIGLEGLLIVSAFAAIAVGHMVGGTDASQAALWFAFLVAVLASTLMVAVFAVVTIRYKADQIIAGLAVWFVALGLGPFLARVLWGTVNSPSVATLGRWNLAAALASVPLVGPPLVAALAAIPDAVAAVPVVGPPVAGPLETALNFLFQVLFNAGPTVYMMLIAVPSAWYVLNRTQYGRWIRASGENPKALDTAGVNVTRVRYASVLVSGVLAGIGGAGLALDQVGQFIGSGQTMVNGRGWIGITAYLFGNYNPVGAFGASFLFAALQALQIRVQQVAFLDLPSSLVRIVPFVTVVVVLALVGKTRLPDAAGEHYESGEE
ncbi:ABC transporter permease [Halobacteriales archaeon QS_1_68_20]|nr:MAG: ABC transporter permease [Halobacteriales archaeon QS_1_68_20]